MKHPEDFWNRVDIRGPDECWPWKGKLSIYGYPQLEYQGKQWRGNRLAFFLTHGPIPDEAKILHDCSPHPDNRACCNPGHIYAGTPLQNWIDGVTRGGNHFKTGISNLNGKLTDFDISRAFGMRRRGKKQGEIAEFLGVSRSHIANIFAGRRRPTVPKSEM